MNRRVLVLTVFSIGIFTTVACSDATQSTSPMTEKQSVTTDSFVDGNGWTWHKVDEIDSDVESSPSNRGGEDTDGLPSIKEMTVEEVADNFQPILEFNQEIYVLSEEDATEMAEQMKAAEEAGVNGTDPAMPLGGSLSQSGTSSNSTSSTQTSVSQSGAGKGSATYKDGGYVFGGDERTAIPSNTWPDMMIADGDGFGGCTGFKLMGHHMAATAAHCVFDAGTSFFDGIDGWRSVKSWTFSPDDTITGIDEIDKGCVARIVPAAYRTVGHHVGLDFAAVLFQSPLGACDMSNYDVGYFGVKGLNPTDGKVNYQLGGYPDPTPFGTSHPDYYVDQDKAWVRRAKRNRLVYNIDGTDGNSGGPVAKRKPTWGGHEYVRVSAVHSGWVDFALDSRNQGRRITGGIYYWYEVMKNITSLPQQQKSP